MSVPGMDFNKLDPAYHKMLLKGIEAGQDSVFREVFTPENVTEMSGKIPNIDSKYTLAQDDASEATKIAIDDEPQPDSVGISETAFRFTGKYAKEHKVHKSVVETLADLEGAEDLVQYLQGLVRMKINSAIDLDGKTILQSQTENNTVAAQDAWSSTGSADPLTDFDAMVDEAGMPDLCWLGIDKARELQALDAFKADNHNYSGTNARAPQQAVVEELRRRYGFEQVIIDAKFYNQDNVAQTINKAKIFDGTVWVGNSDHMVVTEREDLMEVDGEYNSKSGNFHEWMTEYVEINRAEGSQGVVLTGS